MNIGVHISFQISVLGVFCFFFFDIYQGWNCWVVPHSLTSPTGLMMLRIPSSVNMLTEHLPAVLLDHQAWRSGVHTDSPRPSEEPASLSPCGSGILWPLLSQVIQISQFWYDLKKKTESTALANWREVASLVDKCYFNQLSRWWASLICTWLAPYSWKEGGSRLSELHVEQQRWQQAVFPKVPHYYR